MKSRHDGWTPETQIEEQKQGPIYDSTQFSWMDRRGLTEDSTLGPIDPNRHWHVAHECAFYIRSAKTGEVIAFYPVPDEDGYDGEMWVFKGHHNDGGEIIITILND